MVKLQHHLNRIAGSILLAGTLILAGLGSLVHPTSDGRDGISFPGVTMLSDSAPPSIDQPPDQRVLLDEAGVVITWTITDPENASGLYLVALDDFDLEDHLFELPSMMRTWINDTAFNVPVDTSQAGAHNHTILFTDMSLLQLIEAASGGDPISWGADTVWVTVETPPVIQAPGTLRIHEGETGRVLNFSIADPDSPTGLMNVTMNGTSVLPMDTQWNASQVVSLPLNTSSSGIQNYAFVATDSNYTVNGFTTVWISTDFPPEILDLANHTVSPDVGSMTWALRIVDMENSTGNYTITWEGQIFNVTHSNATWINNTVIYLNYTLNGTGRVDFRIVAEDLVFNEMVQDFSVYVNIPPTITAPPDSSYYHLEDPHDISWTIVDPDSATGTRVIALTSPLGATFQLANSTWQSGVPFDTPAYTTFEGAWNYTLFYSDGYSIRRVTTIVTILPARLLDEPGIAMALLAFIAAGFIGVGIIMTARKKN